MSGRVRGGGALCAAILSMATLLGCSDSGRPAAAVTDMAMAAAADLSTPYPGILCGDSVCANPEVCCLRPAGAEITQACEAALGCDFRAVRVACDGPEDCAAYQQDCCGEIVFNRYANPDMGASGVLRGVSECVSSCTGSAVVAMDDITVGGRLCHTAAECKGFIGVIFESEFSFDGCCYRPEAPSLRFCAPLDTGLMDIGGYLCSDQAPQ